MTRPIALAALTVLELAPPQMVMAAAQAGYSHLGLRLIPATPDEPRYPLVGDTPMVAEIARLLADTGMRVFDIEIFRLRPDTKVSHYEPAIATGARLGAQHVLVAGNDPEEGRLADRFAELCELAGTFGLHANVEFMPWTDVPDLAQAQRLLAAAGRPNCGVLVDAIHFDRAGSRIEELASVPARWLHYMQLCDAPAERPTDTAGLLAQARCERLFPGEGGLDLRRLLQALPRDIPISVEIPRERLAKTVGAVERARRALAATKTLLAGLKEPPP